MFSGVALLTTAAKTHLLNIFMESLLSLQNSFGGKCGYVADTEVGC